MFRVFTLLPCSKIQPTCDVPDAIFQNITAPLESVYVREPQTKRRRYPKVSRKTEKLLRPLFLGPSWLGVSARFLPRLHVSMKP